MCIVEERQNISSEKENPIKSKLEAPTTNQSDLQKNNENLKAQVDLL